MIKFFRKIRQRMITENRFSKYLLYATGEIVLVVIGILIALQINNWNQDNIQKKNLDDILKSIANGVQLDLRELQLLSKARTNIGPKVDSISGGYIYSNRNSLNIEEASYINFAFTNILNTIQFKSNLSAFESLKSSTYFSKLQGTDLALLLSTYYTAAEGIRSSEEGYNETIRNLWQEWEAAYRNNGASLFMNPWDAGDFDVVGPRFLEILRNSATVDIFEQGFQERRADLFYQEQILLGKKLIQMIRGSQMNFDPQTEVELGGILFSLGDVNLVSLVFNGEIPSSFELRYAASGLFRNYFQKEEDYISILYPENAYEWGSVYFAVNALSGRVNEMDFSPFSKVIIEMKGNLGGENIEVAMKDVNDPPDGSETRIKYTLTDEWKTYEIDTKDFVTADLKSIMVPFAFIFLGPTGQNIHVRSIQFQKN